MKLTPFISLLLLAATPAVAKEAPPLTIALPTVKQSDRTDFAQLDVLMRRYQPEPSIQLDTNISLERIKPPKRYDPGHFYRDPSGFGPVLTLRF